MSDLEEKLASQPQRRAGVLTSSLTIELHTHYAIRLWAGRRREEISKMHQVAEILGMPQVIKRAGNISVDIAADNPYADAWLVKLEQKLEAASTNLQQSLATLQDTLNAVPKQITLSSVSSVEPLNIGVYSHSPLGYRCVWLLVGYDQLAMKTFQVFHYGLISRAERDAFLHNGSRAIRQIYGLVRSYRSLAVTRQDIAEKTQAGLGRARADWLTGINLTRLYTLKAQALGFGDVLSIGRVQTPALALVVNRDKEISHFVPKHYWQVMVKLEKDNTHFQAKWLPAAEDGDAENRCLREAVAQAVQQRCQQAMQATVMAVSKKREKTPPPLCFDLGTLQQTASRRWGMGASQVLAIAQSLYETHKATTYPRTDCGYLPVPMQADISVVLTALVRTDPAMADIISQLDKRLVSRVWNDKKITAHHAIIPTRHAFDLTRLTTDELQVYQLIRQHYLAQFLPVQETDVTEVTLDIGGQHFRVKGRVNVVTGWKTLLTDEAGEQAEQEMDLPLPVLHQGARCQIVEVNIRSLQTKPPAPFTEGTLIAAMKNAASLVSDPQLKQVLRESAGLGTEATRAGILDTLFKRGLIERKKKAIQSTPLARELVAGLPEVLTSPGMTALWEQSLEDIAQGKTSLAVFMQKQVQWLLHLVERGKALPLQLTLPKTPDCPNCGSRMRQRQGKTSPFWGCVNYPGCKGMLNAKALTQSRKVRRANQKV